mgnify:CR=1 FL=1
MFLYMSKAAMEIKDRRPISIYVDVAKVAVNSEACSSDGMVAKAIVANPGSL